MIQKELMMHEHRKILKHTLILFGRTLISMAYIIASIHQMLHFEVFQHSMVQEGLPYADILLSGMIGIELVGGLLLLLGLKTRLSAGILLFLMVPATIVFHLFWLDEPTELLRNMPIFIKMLGLMGGLMYILAVGGGSYSFDHRRQQG